MIIYYQSVILITILISTINSHGYHQERDRQGNERTWFQMSIPFLDASIQFPQPPGLDLDRLFDMMTSPFQQWNPSEPPPFMRPFYDRPSQFRPMIPPPPPVLPPFNPSLPPSPSSEPPPSTSSVAPSPPSTSSPNSISHSEPESTFSISSSTYNPSRRRYKPRWVPHHPRRPFTSKRPGSGGRRGSGSDYGGVGNSFGDSSSNGNGGGCRNVPGTKGGRKCRPGQRFWEKSKPSSPLPHPGWPFFIFPPPRPSVFNDDDDDEKPEVPNTFTEVTKNVDPACGNRHLPRPTKPSTNDSNPTTSSPDIENNNERDNDKSINVTSTSPSPSPSSTKTELPTTSVSSVDIEPSPSSESSPLSPSSSSVPPSSERPSTSPEVLKSSNVEPEKNPFESDSRNGSNGSEGESGKKEEERKDQPESSSVSYLPNEDEKEEDKKRERTNINNGKDISSSGTMTTMGPLERSPEEDVKGKQGESEERKQTIGIMGKDEKNKINSKENDKDSKIKEDETVDLKYSSSWVTSIRPELSSSPETVPATTSSPNDDDDDDDDGDVVVNNGSTGERTTMNPTDLGNNGYYSMNEADTIPDENIKGIGNSNNDDDDDDKKSVSSEVEVKRKRQTEKEQFIKQIESMSIEDFRRLASKIASISI